MLKSILYLFITINYGIIVVNPELYSSVSDFEEFVKTETESVEQLDDFVKSQATKLKNLKQNIGRYKTTVKNGVKFGTDNPVAIYATMKNFMTLWNKITSEIEKIADEAEKVGQIIEVFRENRRVQVPTEEDLKMSREALVLLQNVYNLNPERMASGNINGLSQLPKLTLDANDCFKIALIYINNNDSKNGLLWLDEALRRLKNEKNNPTVDRADVLKYYAIATVKEKEANNSFVKLNNGDAVEEDSSDDLTSVHNSLCQLGDMKNRSSNARLICYYKNDLPFLRLAPFKVELVNLDPKIYMFRQVLSDNEIEVVISLSKTKLRRAKINNDDGTTSVSKFRTAKLAWLEDDEHDIISVLNQRVTDMTNLDLTSAELTQVVHYGIGGHYDLHYDTMDRPDDRIATVLFYMSTPMAGGATVFPLANLSVLPSKNDAVFWYNLLKNGETNPKTKHGSCPVLLGKKWILNKWLHEYGQEFRRKCSLKQNE